MKKQILLTLGLVTLLASATQASQEKLAASIRDARGETIHTADQLKITLDVLTGLTKQTKGDLRPAFNAFTAEIPKTEAAAASTRARVQLMGGDGQKYFADWQQTISGVANESLRKKAQKRFDAAKKSYDKVGVALKDTGEKFSPFLSDLTDIQKVLSTDVTAAGVKSLKSTVSDANWRHKGVKWAVDSALSEMKKMEKSLSAEAK